MFLSDYLIQENMSQGEFARQCKLSAAAVSRIINGQRFPSPETMYTILIATGGKVGADDFFRERVARRSSNNSLS